MKIFLGLCLLTLSINAPAQEERREPASATVQQTPVVSNVKVERHIVCDVTTAQMPLINGLKLGMSYEEIKTAYPEIESNEHFQKTYVKTKAGLAMFAGKEISNPENKQFLRQISLNVEDAKLNTVNIIYSSKVNWKSLDEMTESFSETLGIGRERWKILNEGQLAELTCKDFVVYLNYLTTDPNKPYISMTFGSSE